MQGDDLVANDVVARCDIGWNGHRRGEVVGYTHTHMLVRAVISAEGGKRGKRKKNPSAHTHHVIAGPDARSSGAIIQTIGLDFDEAEIGFCNIGELASNRCEVGDDRTMVGFRPSVPAQWERRVSKMSRRSVVADGSVGPLLPLEIDAGASSNWNAAQAGSSILVAIQSVSTLPVAPPGGSQ